MQIQATFQEGLPLESYILILDIGLLDVETIIIIQVIVWTKLVIIKNGKNDQRYFGGRAIKIF